MGDKRTGKKRKKVRPEVKESSIPNSRVPLNGTKKTNTSPEK
jgi:hypothetical protein